MGRTGAQSVAERLLGKLGSRGSKGCNDREMRTVRESEKSKAAIRQEFLCKASRRLHGNCLDLLP